MTPCSPAFAAVDALLADGRVVTLRALEPTDGPQLRELDSGLSPSSRYFRFFGVGTQAGMQYVEHLLTDPDVLGIVATVGQDLIGVASAEVTAPNEAELAITVADDIHGMGVGTLLLERTATLCRERGISRIVADVLAHNHDMMRVLTDAGVEVSSKLRDGVVRVAFSTAAASRVTQAADERESKSEARSLSPLLHPRSVAVAGVRRSGTGAGAAVLQAIVEGGFTGALAVLHPEATEILGVPAFSSFAAIPGEIDLLVIAVPASLVEAVVEQAAVAGVRSIVVVSAGFEALDGGTEIQQRILRVARRHSVRLVGPNCLGVLTNTDQGRLNATFGRLTPPQGGLALASQSGGVGIAVLDEAARRGVGVHSFMSLGSKLDVSGNDLLSVWCDDPEVTAAGLYLESFGNPRKFLRVARRFSERKPLLAVRAARSASAQRAEAAHTAAVGGSASGAEALFAQAGVLICDDIEALVDTALVLSQQPLPAGHRVAILTNAAGPGVLAADAIEDAGLQAPLLSPELRQRIAAIVPEASLGNPLDLGPGPSPAQLADVRQALVGSGEVDSLLTLLVDTRITDSRGLLDVLGEGTATPLTEILVPLGAVGDLPTGATAVPEITSAARILRRLADYAAWRRDAAQAEASGSDPSRGLAARRTAEGLLKGAADQALAADELRSLLRPYGLHPRRVVSGDAVELTLRLQPDPALGKLVTLTYSGQQGELWARPVVLVPPIAVRDARAAARDLRTWPGMTEGAHHPPFGGDFDDVLLEFSSLATDVPELVEASLELAVSASDVTVVDARGRLVPAPPFDDGAAHL